MQAAAGGAYGGAMTQTYDASGSEPPSTAVHESPFPNVLCAVDGNEAAYEAVGHAAALTGPNGHLTLLGVTSYRLEGNLRSPAIPPLEMKEILDRATEIAHAANVPVVDEVDPASPPAGTILDWSVDYD